MGEILDPEQSILIVDDDSRFCDTLTRILSSKYNVNSATSIHEAEEFLKYQQYAVLIIDYDLNDEMNGIEFSRYVRMITPLSFTIMLTGNSDFNVVKEALNEGRVNRFMIKPFDVEEFLTVIDRGIAEFSSRHEISLMLQSTDGVKMAQNLLTQVFDEEVERSEIAVDLTGVVISRNSIPVYSKFLNTTYLKKFTDTIFSGFMTAINMVGQEVFMDDSNVDSLKFGEVSIYFKFFKQFQFSFIIHHENDIQVPNKLKFFDEFVEEVSVKVESNPNYFKSQNKYIEELDSRLDKLKESILV